MGFRREMHIFNGDDDHGRGTFTIRPDGTPLYTPPPEPDRPQMQPPSAVPVALPLPEASPPPQPPAPRPLGRS